MKMIVKCKKNNKISIQALGKLEKYSSFYKLIKNKWKYRNINNLLDYILDLIKTKENVKNFEIDGNVIKITALELDDKKRCYVENTHTIELDKSLLNDNSIISKVNNLSHQFNVNKDETLQNIAKNEDAINDFLDLDGTTVLNKKTSSLQNIMKFLEKNQNKLASNGIIEISSGLLDKFFKFIPILYIGMSICSFGNLFDDFFNYEFFNLKYLLLGCACPLFAYATKIIRDVTYKIVKKDYIKSLIDICKNQISYRKSTSKDLLMQSKNINKVSTKENDYIKKAIKELLSALSTNPNEEINKKIFELKMDYQKDKKSNIKDFIDPVLSKDVLEKRYSYLNRLLEIEREIAYSLSDKKKKYTVLKPFRSANLKNKLNFLGLNDETIEYNRPIMNCLSNIKETIMKHRKNPDTNINKYCVDSYQNIIDYAYTLMNQCIEICKDEEFIQENRLSTKGYHKSFKPVISNK